MKIRARCSACQRRGSLRNDLSQVTAKCCPTAPDLTSQVSRDKRRTCRVFFNDSPCSDTDVVLLTGVHWQLPLWCPNPKLKHPETLPSTEGRGPSGVMSELVAGSADHSDGDVIRRPRPASTDQFTFLSSSHVVPYGFGSVRLRRDLPRCLCTHVQDTECVRFCSVQTE